MNKTHMAWNMRRMMENTAKDLTDEEALEVVYAYPRWKEDTTYFVGDRVRYGDYLYKVLQEHTSQSEWTPPDAPSLFAQVLPGQDGDIGEWVQPGSTNPYMKGDKVLHNGKKWESIIDNNVWEPGVYGWEEIE